MLQLKFQKKGQYESMSKANNPYEDGEQYGKIMTQLNSSNLNEKNSNFTSESRF